jgi:hypothetical protein
MRNNTLLEALLMPLLVVVGVAFRMYTDYVVTSYARKAKTQ